ncbi:MAG: helix-turn-helix domain-containing protein, partial [Nanoarchaeota archaeon]
MYEELKEFGLSDNEIKIYIELLKTGATTANRISKLTGVKRSTTYDNLNLLANKGLVSSIIKEKVIYFEAIDPKKIMRLMEEKKEKLSKVVKELRSLIEVKKEEGGASFFEGKRGVI